MLSLTQQKATLLSGRKAAAAPARSSVVVRASAEEVRERRERASGEGGPRHGRARRERARPAPFSRLALPLPLLPPRGPAAAGLDPPGAPWIGCWGWWSIVQA